MLFRDVLTIAATQGGGLLLTPTLLLTDGIFQHLNKRRVIADDGKAYLLTVTGTTSGGNVEAHKYEPGQPIYTRHQQTRLEVDDHVPGSLLKLSGGRMMSFYAKHSDVAGLRYRVTTNALPDVKSWGVEKTVAISAGMASNSYNQAFLLEGNVYVFQRGNSSGATNYPQQMVKTAEADVVAGTETWTRTSIFDKGAAGARPYPVICENGTDRLDFAIADTASELFHIYMQIVGGVAKWYQSDGTEITEVKPFNIATYGTEVSDDSNGPIIVQDISIGNDGHPRILYAQFPSGQGSLRTDIEYWHARWTGAAWSKFRLFQNQHSLPDAATQLGGIVFDGNDCAKFFVSETISAVNEISEYSIDEVGQGKTLLNAWTRASARHQFRPFSPIGHNNSSTKLFWLDRVSMASYTAYETNIWTLGPVAAEPDPVSYEAEATAFFARISAQPDATRKKAYNRLILDLKAGAISGSDIWAKCDHIYWFAAHDEQTSKLSLKSATGDLVKAGSAAAPVFTVDSGWKGDGSVNSYLEGVAYNSLTQYQRNSAHYCALVGHIGTAGTGAAISRVAGGSPILMTTRQSSALIRINASAGFGPSNTAGASTAQSLGASRTGASAISGYRGGMLFGTSTEASVAVPSDKMIFANQMDHNEIAATIGASLSSDEWQDLHNALWKMRRTIGA